MTRSQGIFHNFQDNDLYEAIDGSRLTNELVNFRIIIGGVQLTLVGMVLF